VQSPLPLDLQESFMFMRLHYIECQSCFKKSGYDIAADIGKKYIQENKNF